MNSEKQINLGNGYACPLPITEYKNILLAHGGGGKLTNQLIQNVIASHFRNELLEPLHDGAIFKSDSGRFAFTTDSYVINPIFFPGGNIGTLAINGTVNDLAMCGAHPLYISSAFIIEEGMSMDEFIQIVQAMEIAAKSAGVKIITGDTKVVDRGKGDKIFINTSGIGSITEDINISPKNAKPGDKIILSGSIAEHGIAIMSVREGLELETEIQSDCAALNGLVEKMISVSRNIHVLRDPTRGGIASALNEIAVSAKVGIEIFEHQIQVTEEVQAVCEILGFDPLYVANEGKLIAFVASEDAQKMLDAMHSHPLGNKAEIIGEVTNHHIGTVIMKTKIGGTRVVDMLSGEQLPRIC